MREDLLRDVFKLRFELHEVEGGILVHAKQNENCWISYGQFQKTSKTLK